MQSLCAFAAGSQALGTALEKVSLTGSGEWGMSTFRADTWGKEAPLGASA